MFSHVRTALANSRARQVRRDALLEAYGSDIYPWEPGIIGIAGQDFCSLATEFPEALRFMPMDWAQITNQSSVDIEMFLNNGYPQKIPAGTMKIITECATIRDCLLINRGTSATASGEIRVDFMRRPMNADKLAKLQVLP